MAFDRWHLDGVFVNIGGKQMYLWRADLAQAGGPEAVKAQAALDAIEQALADRL